MTEHNLEDITPEGSVSPVLLDPNHVDNPPMLAFPEDTVGALRQRAYAQHADPVFFKWQRGEATEQDWLDAVQAVKDEYPE